MIFKNCLFIEVLTLLGKVIHFLVFVYWLLDKVRQYLIEDMVLVVEVEDRTIKKPFLGGWRHKITGVEYLNANSQTGPRKKRIPWNSLCTQPIQTVETKTQFTETPVNRATQMWRKDCYVPNVSDQYIAPRPYESYEVVQLKLNIEGRVRMIQKYYRAYRIAKFIRESAATYRQVIADCKRHEEENILAYKKRHQRDIIRKTYPSSRSDFDMLYNLMDQWKNYQTKRVSRLFFKGAQRAASVMLLNKSVDMLKDIDRRRQYIKTKFLERRSMEFLTFHCDPIKWNGYKAKTTQMVTVKVQRAREFKRLHDNLIRSNISVEERIELLVMLKNSVKNHYCYAVNELVYLLDQEIELTSRGIKNMLLNQLRRRIKNAFLYFVQNSDNCTCKWKDDFSSRDLNCEELRVPLETTMLFCRRCFRLLPYHRFSAHVRMKKILFCSACESLIVRKQARIDYSLFTYLLNGLRADEMKRNCFSSLIFVMRVPGICHLVNNIWHGRSIISENDDLFKLRLGRFDINVEWSPWNCILLTEEEAEAHYYIKDFRTVYAQSLLDKIFLIQEQAKSHFRELVMFEKHFRESSGFYMVQERKEYKAPKTVENYAPRELET